MSVGDSIVSKACAIGVISPAWAVIWGNSIPGNILLSTSHGYAQSVLKIKTNQLTEGTQKVNSSCNQSVYMAGIIRQPKFRTDSELNLAGFAHNWNDGMLEYWNNGYSSLDHVEKYDD